MASLSLLLRLVSSSLPVPDGVDTVSGPYKINSKLYENFHQDPTNFKIDVYFPVSYQNGTGFGAKPKFPLIAFAHGLFGGGVFEDAYTSFLKSLASFGYVVGSTRACTFGCWDSKTLPHDPPGFADYYVQQLKIIDFAKDKLQSQVDFTPGVGISGHSMGGQATLFSSSYGNASKYDVKAAVMHHAYTHVFPAPTIPFLAFTGKADDTASMASTASYYNASGANPAKGMVNRVDADHMEPCEGSTYNPLLAQYTAAWFKLHIDKTPHMKGVYVNGKPGVVDFDGMIFGTDKQSLCGGADGKMVACEVHRG